MKTLFKTENSWTPLFLRVTLGLVVFAHGAQKLLGWFNGYGFDGTMTYFTETVGLSWVIGFAVILLESIGAILLISGFSTRVLAIAFTILGVGISSTIHIQHGFFMNWAGNQSGEGIEFFILWLAMSGSLIISGGGRYSIDQLIFRNN